MDDTSPTAAPTPRRPRRPTDPALRLGVAGVMGLAALVTLSIAILGEAGPLPLGIAIAAYALAIGAAMHLMERDYPHDALGLCNLVTLSRLVVVGALAVPLAAGDGAGERVLALALVALLLDGVDGWLARRSGLTSRFGGRFDMEVDSAFALVLALHAYVGGTVGPLVLLLGVPRYAFGLAGWVLPWLRAPAPERLFRKVACVVQIGVLIVLQLPGLPEVLATAMVVGAGALLAWSFWGDVVWLRRQAGR